MVKTEDLVTNERGQVLFIGAGGAAKWMGRAVPGNNVMMNAMMKMGYRLARKDDVQAEPIELPPIEIKAKRPRLTAEKVGTSVTTKTKQDASEA